VTWKLLPDKRIRPLSHARTFEEEECKKIADAFKSADMRSYSTNSFFYSYRLIEPDIWPNIYENITGAVLDSNVTPRDTVVPRAIGMTTIFPSFLASKQEQPTAGIKRAIMGTVSGLPFS
jgi:hypothetical protein